MPVTDQLEAWIKEAYDLRDSLQPGSGSEGVGFLHKELVRARGVVDRLERIVADCTRLRGRTSQAVEVARESLEDAVDKYISGAKTVGFGNEFATGREREAGWRLGTVEERGRLRRAERLLRDVETALTVCRLLHRGADESRRDLDSRIRLIALQSRLES